MSEHVDLVVFRKTTKTYELRFKYRGAAKDITGWSVYFTVKEAMKDLDTAAKINHDITSHQDAVNGKTVIELTQVDTDRVGSYHYDITFKDPEGNVGVLYFGRIKFVEKSTRRA